MKPITPLHVQPPAPKPRYFRLTYSNARADEDSQLFKCRDGVAFFELAAPLPSMGYDPGTTIYLYPYDDQPLSHFPTLQPSDLLVLSTRPPLHDTVGIVPANRKVIYATKTEIEDALFQELSKYFEYCTRKHVQLSKPGIGHLRVRDSAKWEHVELKEYRGETDYCAGEIKKHFVGPVPLKPQADRHSTIVFFLRANRVKGLNCDFIASFGMDGFGTLIWNRYIRIAHPEWLAKPGFIMAELIFKQRLPDKPPTPEFVDDGKYIEVELLT